MSYDGVPEDRWSHGDSICGQRDTFFLTSGRFYTQEYFRFLNSYHIISVFSSRPPDTSFLHCALLLLVAVTLYCYVTDTQK